MSGTQGLVLLLAMSLQSPVSDTSPGSSAALLQAVADVHDENRARFGFGSVEFEYWDGSARDLRSAVHGDLRDPHMALGNFAFDAGNALYFKLFSNESLASTSQKSGDQYSGRLDSVRLLTNGKLTFAERLTVGGAGGEPAKGHIITPGSDDFFRNVEFPLALGRPESARSDMARIIRMVLDGAVDYRVSELEEDVDLDGVKTIRIALALPNGTRTYWVDLERGAIPIRVHDDVLNGEGIDIHHGDLRHVEGRGWMPFEMTTYLEGGRAKRLVFTQADFETPPSPGTFTIELDEPTAVANIADGRSYTARTVYDLNDLPGSGSSESRALGTAGPAMSPDSGLPGEREPRPPYYTIAAVVLAVVIAIVFWHRARSN